MKCPECKTSGLLPDKIEPSLAARTCQECSGSLINLMAYRMWLERHSQESKEISEFIAAPKDETRALLCPSCERIMLRFKYLHGTTHSLEVCFKCDHVWLQDNEWEFLKSHELQGELTQIFTQPWQRSFRKLRTSQVLESEWDRKLGKDLHSEAKEIKNWMENHPKRQDILNYFLAEDPYNVS